MSMPIPKARNLLKAYKENDFNAKAAMEAVGYSSVTADKQSARTIKSAVNAVSSAPDAKNDPLAFLGLSEDDLKAEYLKVVKQDKNFPAKLRAMEPLVRAKGITFDSEDKPVTVPILNITTTPTREVPPKAVENGSTEP